VLLSLLLLVTFCLLLPEVLVAGISLLDLQNSSAEADRASALVCIALLFTFNSPTSSLRAFLFSPATTLHFALF